jgi:hypothetical protein
MTSRKPARGPIEDAVSRDVAAWEPEGQSARVALALTLARALDDGAGLATAAVARELRAVLSELQPEEVAAPDALDDLIRRLSTPPRDSSPP